MNDEDLLEKIADFMHDQWSHWMNYLFSQVRTTSWNEFDSNLIRLTFRQKETIDRWKRQLLTPYSELSEKEKDSDREWAKKLIKMLDAFWKEFDGIDD